MNKLIRLLILIAVTVFLTILIVGISFLFAINKNAKKMAQDQQMPGYEKSSYESGNSVSQTIKIGRANNEYITLNNIHEEIMDYYQKYGKYPNSFTELDDYHIEEERVGKPAMVKNGKVISRWDNPYDSFKYTKTKNGFNLCFELEIDYKSFKAGNNCIDQDYIPEEI